MGKRKDRRSKRSDTPSEGKLLKFGSKLLIALVVVLIFLTLVQCTVNKPEAPQWTTQFVLPLVSRTYDMPEIIDKIDQDGISIQGDNVVYNYSQEIDTFAISQDEWSTSDLSFTDTETIGSREVTAPAPAGATVSVAEVGILSSAVGSSIPQTHFDLNKSLAQFDNYEWATVATGSAQAVVSNNLGLDLEVITIELIDIDMSRVIGVRTYSGGIIQGETDTVTFDLAGETISNNLYTRIYGNTLHNDILQFGGGSIDIEAGFTDNFTVIAGSVILPPMDWDFSTPVDLNEDYAVQNAQIESGQLSITVQNQTSLVADMVIRIPDLLSGGDSLVISRTLTSWGTTTIIQSLAGYTLTPQDQTVPQSLAINVFADVDSTGEYMEVAQDDYFALTANIENITFESVTGVFDDIETAIDPTVESLDVPDGFDSIRFTDATVTLEILNAVNLPGSLDLELNGSNGKTLNIIGNVAPGNVAAPVASYIVDTTIANFLYPVPETITISGMVSYGDGLTAATITPDAYVVARVNINAPLRVVIAESMIDTDYESEDLDPDDMEVITEHVEQARLIYQITNHLPVGARVNILLGGDSATLETNPHVSIDNIQVSAAPTTDGVVTDELVGLETEVLLTSEDIQVLSNDTLYILPQIILESSNGLPVQLTVEDYITVTGRMEVEYFFDGEF